LMIAFSGDDCIFISGERKNQPEHSDRLDWFCYDFLFL